jgi:Secretion system C-terminal sorting domain/SprB repeat
LAGSFQNWNPGSTVMTNVGGGIWEKTMLVFQGNAEYKFINGNTWGDEEIVPAACAQNTNRFTNVTAVTTLPVVCFSKCTPCSNLAVSATNTTNVSCNGGNNGSITVTSTGTAGCTPTYNWSNGQTSTTISNLAAGTYTVTATCGTQTATYTTTITQPSAIAFGTPMIQNVTCSAAGSITVNATGGTGTISYLWAHNNSNTPTISVSAAGTYTVSAKDANNCTTTLNVTVTGSGNIPTVQITNQNPAIGCATPSIVLNATSSASNVSYNWTGQGITSGGNSANVTVNATGTYTVVVTNPNNCTASTSIVVSTSGTGAPSFSIQGNTSICQGDSTVLSSSGSFSSYSWSNGAITSSIKVKTPNTYTLTVTGANGCVGSNSATVSIKPTATATLPTKDTLTCTKTTIVLNVITPLTNPNVSWTGPNGYTSTNLTPTITEPGVYNLVIGNATACSNSYSITIYQNTGNQIVSITGGGTFCNKSSTPLSVPPNLGTYLWSNSVTTNSITATQSGTYTVSVTSPNGCKQVKSAMVKISPTFAVNAGEDTKACENKSLILSANSAADNLAYAWTGANNFSYNQKDTTIATVKPSHAGDYFVVATDANGCKATDTIKVLVSPKIDIQLLASVNCKDSANIISQITGGVPNFTYAWSCNSDVTPTTTAIAPIIVTLTVTDSYGCIETSNPALAIDGNFLILLTGSVSAVSNNGKGSISVTATNAAAPIKYLWSNGATTKDLAEIEKGQYCVTVTDGKGCTATECFDVKSTATTSTTDNSIANVIAVYPNPTFDVINIDTKGNLVLTRIELFDINGKILQTHEGDTKQITIESLPNAIYLLKCSTKDGFVIKKIVKQD